MEKHKTLQTMKIELNKYEIDPKTGKPIKGKKIELPKEVDNGADIK